MKSLNVSGGKSYFVLFMFLLLVFEFFSMQTIVFDSVSYYAQLVYLLAFVFSVAILVTSGKLLKNFFLKLFIFWLIYIVLRFITSTTGHGGLSSFFSYTWFCNCYIIVFSTSKQVENREKIFILFYLLLFLTAIFFTYQNTMIFTLGSFNIEEYNTISNIIFWSLCLLPVVFLINNRIWQLVWLSMEVLLVLITMKRSAVISIIIILAMYLYEIFKNNNGISKRMQRRSRLSTIVLVIVVAVFFVPRWTGVIDNNYVRFENIENDGGSGRTDIWGHALQGIENSNFIEILVGHGVASSPTTIGHTSAHNDFLTLIIEFGIIGGVLYLMFIIKVIQRVVYVRKRNRQLFCSYFCLLIILLVVGNVGDLFTCYSYLGFLLAILAVLELRLEQDRIAVRVIDNNTPSSIVTK